MPAPFRYLTLKDVCRAVGVSKTCIYTMARQGKFPRPVKVGAGVISRWSEDEVTAWHHARLAERDALHPETRTA